jgi:uncharacterized phage protein (TIGR02216 family)
VSRFDWPAIMRVGMREHGLRPVEFWALTPAEFWLLLGFAPGGSAMTRDGLDALMAAYPDKKSEVGNDRD